MARFGWLVVPHVSGVRRRRTYVVRLEGATTATCGEVEGGGRLTALDLFVCDGEHWRSLGYSIALSVRGAPLDVLAGAVRELSWGPNKAGKHSNRLAWISLVHCTRKLFQDCCA